MSVFQCISSIVSYRIAGIRRVAVADSDTEENAQSVIRLIYIMPNWTTNTIMSSGLETFN